VRLQLEALPGLPGGHLFLYEKIATSSTPSNPLSASPELFPVSQSATDAAAAAQPTAAADKGFPRLAAPLA
jgi:hypothetical protein